MATAEGLRKARQAGTRTRRIARYQERKAEAARERRRLMLEANRDGVTYAQLHELVGIDPSRIASEIALAKTEDGEVVTSLREDGPPTRAAARAT